MTSVSAATNSSNVFVGDGAVKFLFKITLSMTCCSSEEDELLIDFVKNHDMFV
jgi:hypothetical protein